jgi:hypothetical protein
MVRPWCRRPTPGGEVARARGVRQNGSLNAGEEGQISALHSWGSAKRPTLGFTVRPLLLLMAPSTLTGPGTTAVRCASAAERLGICGWSGARGGMGRRHGQHVRLWAVISGGHGRHGYLAAACGSAGCSCAAHFQTTFPRPETRLLRSNPRLAPCQWCCSFRTGSGLWEERSERHAVIYITARGGWRTVGPH